MLDDIIEIVIEVVGEVLETMIMQIKDPKKRKWAAGLFYGFLAVVLAGFLAWLAVDAYRNGNVTGAIVVIAVAVLLILIFGFVAVRRRRKKKQDP